MPKQWLHDVFASHNDCKKSHSFEKSLQISKQGFNCDCDNLVVEVPFAAAKEFFIDLPVLNVQPVFTLIEDKNFPTVCHFFFQLRGPPAIA